MGQNLLFLRWGAHSQSKSATSALSCIGVRIFVRNLLFNEQLGEPRTQSITSVLVCAYWTSDSRLREPSARPSTRVFRKGERFCNEIAEIICCLLLGQDTQTYKKQRVRCGSSEVRRCNKPIFAFSCILCLA